MNIIDHSISTKEINGLILDIKEELNNHKTNHSDDYEDEELSENNIKIILDATQDVLINASIDVDLADYEDECRKVTEYNCHVFDDEDDMITHLKNEGYTFLNGKQDNFPSMLDDEIDGKLQFLREKFRYDKLNLVKILDNYLL